MASAYSTITSNVNLLLVDTKVITKNGPYIAYVSSVSIPGRIATIRDNTGYLSTPNSIIVSTLSNVLFSDGTSSFSITQPFGYLTISARDPNTWNIINTFAFPQPQGTTNVSTLFVNDAIVATSLRTTYVSTTNLFVNSISSINIQASTISTNTLYANLQSTNLAYMNNAVITQISTNLISSGNIYVNGLSSINISASNISTNYLTVNSISSLNIVTTFLSTSITNTNINNTNTTNSINTNTTNISANIIKAASLSLNNISSVNLYASTIRAYNIQTTYLSSINLVTSNISSINIYTNFLSTPSISTTNILTTNISATTIYTNNASTINLQASNAFINTLSNTTLNNQSISTNLLLVNSISCLNMKANSISTNLLLTNSISSLNINAQNISTNNINVNNISTYIMNTQNINTNYIKSISSLTSTIQTSSIVFQSGTNKSYLTTSSDGTNLLLNGSAVGVWVPTATSALNMNNYNISNVNTVYIKTGTTQGALQVSSDGQTLKLNGNNIVGGWVGTATTNLNMNNLNISNVYLTDTNVLNVNVIQSANNINISATNGISISGGNGSITMNNIVSFNNNIDLNNHNISNVTTLQLIDSTHGSLPGYLQVSFDGTQLLLNSNVVGGGGSSGSSPQTFTCAIMDQPFNGQSLTARSESNYLYYGSNQNMWDITILAIGTTAPVAPSPTVGFKYYFALSNPVTGIEVPLIMNNSNRAFYSAGGLSNLQNTLIDTVNLNTLLSATKSNVPIILNMYTNSVPMHFENGDLAGSIGFLTPTHSPPTINVAYCGACGDNVWIVGGGYDDGLTISGIVSMSYDNGSTWTNLVENGVYKNPVMQAVLSVAYGNDTWVVGTAQDTTTLYYSTDGITFNSNTTINLGVATRGIAYGNNIFVAVGNTTYTGTSSDTSIIYSSNGINWLLPNTSVYLGVPRSDGGYTVQYGNGVFVVGGITDVGGTASLYISADGTNWTSNSSIANVVAVAFGNGRWIASDGLGTMVYSDDNFGSVTSITSAPNLVSIATGDSWNGIESSGYPYYSIDNGVTWTLFEVYSGIDPPVNPGYALAYGNGTYLALGRSDHSAILIGSAVNMITYTLQPTAKQPIPSLPYQ